MTPTPSLDPRPGEWSGIQTRAGRRRRRRQVLTAAGSVGALAVVGVVGGLAVQSSPGTVRIQQVPPAASAPASGGPATPSTAPAGCATPGTLPPNSLTQAILDVDGDGRPDTGFIARGDATTFTVGIRTAAGGVFSTTVTSGNSASTHRGVLFADVSGKGTGPFVALTDDNQYSHLLVVKGCSLVAPVDGEGRPYVFDLGFKSAGDGVACGSVGGVPSLIGFAYVNSNELRTAVDLDLTQTPPTATNGTAEMTTTQDTTRVSCGSTTTTGLELSG